MASLVRSPVVIVAPVHVQPITLSFEWDKAMIVQELYNPAQCAANATTSIIGLNILCSFGGFICTTGGSVIIQDASGNVIIPSVTLTAGQLLPAGIQCSNGLKVVTSGGCVGVALFGTNA